MTHNNDTSHVLIMTKEGLLYIWGNKPKFKVKFELRIISAQ